MPEVLRSWCLAAALGLGLGGLTASAAHASSEATRWPANQATPDFELSDTQGRVWKLSETRGKVVIVNFWASWCEPCRAEMPSLQDMASFYSPDVLVLAVNFKEREARVATVARNWGLTLPLPVDRDGAVAARYGVRVFPSSIIIGRDGKARWRVVGEVDWTGAQAAGWLEPLIK
jgi:thiol-disulfide isomerase/thioredoxin